jgi:hypothetical protein
MATITIDILNPKPIVLGRVGENEADTIEVINAPDTGSVYLDFSLPNGLITQTPALVDGQFAVPHELLTATGHGNYDVVYKSGGVKEVLARSTLYVETAVNADGTLETQYRDVIQNHEERIATIEEGGGVPGPAGEAATIEIGTVTTGEPGSSAAVENVGTESAAVINFTIPAGAPGADGSDGSPGADGIGIASIVRTSGDGSPGTTDTYTITLTNSATATFTVYNGANGATGTDGIDGEDGAPGATGNGIASVVLLSGDHSPGTSDTYRITFTDSSYYDFVVYNGADGAPGVDGTDGEDGADGQSAYAAAQAGGYSGTQSDFYTDLAAIEGLEAALAAL